MTSESIIYEHQKIDLSAVPNARHLGSYPTKDGRKVRAHKLIRCGEMYAATDEDLALLRDQYKVDIVIDLRTPSELKRRPDRRIPGSFYINMPVSDEGNNFWKAWMSMEGNTPEEKLLHFALTDKSKPMIRKMYLGIVRNEYCQLQYAAFFETLLHNDGTVLWHCSQGKDRTGLAAAFLLSILGVDREIVIRDFELTNVPYRPRIDSLCAQLREMGGTEADEEVVKSIEGVNTSNFIYALDYIDNTYGSMEQYVKEIFAITDEEIEILKDRYLI